VLKSLISATIYAKRAAQYEGVGTAEEIASQRRAEAIRELYDFRMHLGLDDGVAELMVYAAPPVRDVGGGELITKSNGKPDGHVMLILG
jgi:hypothetical protein